MGATQRKDEDMNDNVLIGIPGVPFTIGQGVRIIASGEKGRVRGLAIYSDSIPQALVHYTAGDGRAVTAWWEIDLIESDSPIAEPVAA